jgi:7-cyano-7-deazaguanine synthase
LSGGIDSAVLLALAHVQATSTAALHVSYGQAAAHAERAAASRVANHFGVGLTVIDHRGQRFGAGEIRGRNAFLLQVALLHLPWTSGTILLGVHAGTDYRDCGEPFLTLMQGVYDFHTDGAVSVAAPFAELLKGDIVRLAADLDVPISLTHSCEASDDPCSDCQSCHDRETILSEAARAGA